MHSSKSSAFLMELILSILFFSIASAVCIQLFAKAHLLDQKTGFQNQAVIWSETLSSLWQASDGALSPVWERLSEDYPESTDAIQLSDSGMVLTIALDKNGQPVTDSSQTALLAELTGTAFDENTLLQQAELVFFVDGETFYRLSLTHHIQLEKGGVRDES